MGIRPQLRWPGLPGLRSWSAGSTRRALASPRCRRSSWEGASSPGSSRGARSPPRWTTRAVEPTGPQRWP
eukprot:13202391-Alexandrium_andersonii.AAC.1